MADPSTQPGPRRNLKKNQACLQCRRGKMKCDAAQPHCTNCIKAWQILLETPGEPGSSAPTCDYDRVEGLIFTPEKISDPAARARVIQRQLAQLTGKLQEARDEAGYRQPSHLKRRLSGSSSSTSPTSGIPHKRRRTSGMDSAESVHSESGFTILPPITSDPLAGPPQPSGSYVDGSPYEPPSRTADSQASGTALNGNSTNDLLPAETLEQLIDLFIANESHASRIFHPQRLRDAFVPQSTSRPAQRSGSAAPPSPPAKALLHAICASAARYVVPSPTTAAASSSSSRPPNPNSRPQLQLPPGFAEYHAEKARCLINAALTEHQDTLYLEQDGADPISDADHDENAAPSLSRSQGGRTSSSSTESSSRSREAGSSRTGSPDDQQPAVVEEREDRDARKRRMRMRRDARLFTNMVQPLLVLATYYYHEGRGPEVWADIGALARAIMSLGLNHPSDEQPQRGRSKASLIAEEERKRAFWSTFILDRLLSAGGWSHSMTEDDTVKNFVGNSSLLTASDFRDLGVQRSSKPQEQQSRVYIPPKTSDSYSLLIDAVVLLGRITDFRSHARLQHRSALAQSLLSNNNNKNGLGNVDFRDASFSFILAQDPILRWEFSRLSAELNGGVGYWSSYGISGKGRREGDMPLLFKYSIGLADVPNGEKGSKGRSMVDMDLFLAHMVHYAATILLHFPMASFDVQSRPHSQTSIPSLLHTPTLNNDVAPHIDHEQQIRHRSLPEFSNERRPPPILHSELNAGRHSLQPILADNGAIVSASCINDSRKECVDAAKKIVDALALLRCTTFDISNVHPFGATCWYIAGVVLLYEHRRWIAEGDIIQQTALSKDVQILRLSLLKYGQRSGIGIRLEEELTASQERIAGNHRGSPTSEQAVPEQTQDFQHDVMPIFPFDGATYHGLPKTGPTPLGGAPLPQYLA